MKDWRLANQETYLKNKGLRFIKFEKFSEKWEHEHCEFCWIKFSDNDLKEGYCTLDKQNWICSKCYNDFKDKFNWKLK